VGDVDKLQKLLADAFGPDKAAAYGEAYLEVVRANSKDAGEAVRKSLLVLVALDLLFVIVDVAAVKKVAFGPVEITDLAVVQKLIPVLIAYVLYTGVMFQGLTSTYTRVHQAAVRVLYPSMGSAEVFLRPATVTLFGAEALLEPVHNERAERRFVFAIALFAIVVLLALLVFEAWALYRLLDRYGVSDVGSWLSILASSLLLALVVLLVLTERGSSEE